MLPSAMRLLDMVNRHIGARDDQTQTTRMKMRCRYQFSQLRSAYHRASASRTHGIIYYAATRPEIGDHFVRQRICRFLLNRSAKLMSEGVGYVVSADRTPMR